ncbi:hypothetical protein [Streptomyces sp. NPDC006335]|uniref:hypothetical protein n=1 Tax=Streptomyces sp. NPDC006335 TaxID=3156895 RepID=UPI0033B0D5B5
MHTASDRAALDALVASAASGADVDAGLTTLIESVGLPEPRRRRVITGVFGIDGGHTDADLYVCPAGLCSRTWLNVPGKDGPPRCAIAGTPLIEA